MAGPVTQLKLPSKQSYPQAAIISPVYTPLPLQTTENKTCTVWQVWIFVKLYIKQVEVEVEVEVEVIEVY